MTVVEVNASPREVYRITTSNGGEVVLYCTETIYAQTFDRLWVRNRRFASYMVYGQCNEHIPVAFAGRIARGFHSGALLPRTASRQDQKKAVIHAFISLIVGQLSDEMTP